MGRCVHARKFFTTTFGRAASVEQVVVAAGRHLMRACCGALIKPGDNVNNTRAPSDLFTVTTVSGQTETLLILSRMYKNSLIDCASCLARQN